MFAHFSLNFSQQKVCFAQVLAFSKVAKMEGEVVVALWASKGDFEPSRATISPQSPCSLIPGAGTIRTWHDTNLRYYVFSLVGLSLLTMTNPNQLCDVLLFMCSKMADETNLSSKLPVADRTREVWRRKLCGWCLSSGFPLCTFLLSFADSFCFVFISSPFYEASPLCTILCNLFPWLCWYVEVFKGGFEGVLVSLLLTTMGAFSYLKFSIQCSH